MSYRVFISYSTDDKECAREIHNCLTKLGAAVVIDCEVIVLGDHIREQIKAELNACDILVVIVSPGSQKSSWVPFEIGLALNREPPPRIIQYLTHPKMDIPPFLSGLRYAKSLNELCAFFPEKAETGTLQYARTVPQNISRLHNLAQAGREGTRILVIGQTCWDKIVDPSGNIKDRIGGSTYYVTRAIRTIAKLVRRNVSIDVMAPLGQDRAKYIESEFKAANINTYFKPQPKTLCFRNHYLDKEDWTKRSQEVIVPPPLSIGAIDFEDRIVQKLQQHYYDIVFLLTLTPYDFLNISKDMVPFLKRHDPQINIAVELQGLTRDVPKEGGVVRKKVDEACCPLLQQCQINCCHCSIDEGLEIVQYLAVQRGVTSPPDTLPPKEIGVQLSKYGINIGLTNGGRGAFVAWQNDDGDFLPQYIPTPDVSGLTPTPYATGAGDTWLGIYAYLLLGLEQTPIIAGVLATHFATLKCYEEGALSEQL